jgi:hypothetical protein
LKEEALDRAVWEMALKEAMDSSQDRLRVYDIQWVRCFSYKAKYYGAIFMLFIKNFKITQMEWSVVTL